MKINTVILVTVPTGIKLVDDNLKIIASLLKPVEGYGPWRHKSVANTNQSFNGVQSSTVEMILEAEKGAV